MGRKCGGQSQIGGGRRERRMTPAEAALARLLEPPARPSPEQRRAVALAARGLSLFLRLPTGAGKSAAFQAPALLAAGATLVVAPLVALVEDQAAALRRRGVPVAQLTAADRRRDREPLEQRLRGRQLVYTTPEFLLQNAEMRAWLRGAAADARVARLVLDEAHCVFEWGHAFRPAYLELARWKARALPAVPVTLATASVSDADVHHLARVLGLRIVHGHEADETPDDAADAASRLVLVQQLADRPNLELEVLRKPADAAALVARRVGTAAAIVYCLTRKEAEDTSLQLARFGCSAGVYHGGLPRSRREFVRKQWMLGRLSVICATSAFGMGIDRPDVRFVVHHSIPMSLSAYMQQIGRAGRDGEPAECILLYDPNDKARALNLSIERQDAGGETVVSGGASMRDLNDVVAFCEMQPHECRREFLYSRFGMSFTKLECAERCNCNMPRNDVEVELEREVNNDIDRSSLRDARAGDDDGPSQSTIEYYYQRVRAEAKRNGLPKRESLSRQVIKAVLKAQPSSKDEMARLKGVGDSRAQLYFDLFRFDR